MEKLLDQADALVFTAQDGIPRRPNFEIPTELIPFTNPLQQQQFLEGRESQNKGRGWFAKQNIPAGTILMVAKPLAWVMDCECDDNDIDDEEMEADMEAADMEDAENPNNNNNDSPGNELLILNTLEAIKSNPSIWNDQITHLYPRESATIEASPAWVCKDEKMLSKFQKLVTELESIPQLGGKSLEISQRLPLIIRYNVLSVETCPELLSYPGPTGHASLAGVGLYYLPSFFNHDSRPNVSRYAVGDIMWFVANQDIPAGKEACISYLEHDILCENVKRRNAMMTLDFKEEEDDDEDDIDDEDDPTMSTTEENGPNMPVVDSEVQNELMSMPIFERLESIEQLMRQASGEASPEEMDDDGMDAQEEEEGGGAWFKCDLQNLRIVKAITLEGMGKSADALPIWEECVNFIQTSLPPNDESIVVVLVQAALCALTLQQEARAKHHADLALHIHNLLFGGGVIRFRRRYQKEFSLNLRSGGSGRGGGGQALENILWPLP